MSAHPADSGFERFDELEPGPRAVLLEHAASCAGCRARLIAVDPTRSFALLAVAPLPQEALERLSRRLDRQLDQAPGRSARRVFGFASLAASLLLAGVLSTYLWREAPSIHLSEESSSGLLELPQPVTRAVPLGQIELLSSPGTAQVLDLSVGGTQVVMIFDESIDI